MIVILRILRGVIGFIGATAIVNIGLSYVGVLKEGGPAAGSGQSMVVYILLAIISFSIFFLMRKVINHIYEQKSEGSNKISLKSTWEL